MKNVGGSDQQNTAGKSKRKSDRYIIPVAISTIDSEKKGEKYEAGAGRGLPLENYREITAHMQPRYIRFTGPVNDHPFLQ